MSIPQKTPRLKLRIVSGSEAVQFTASTPSQFAERYRQALEIAESEFSISSETLREMFHDNLHLKQHGRWFRLQTLPASELANKAYDGENVRFHSMPEYDLNLAILKAGSAKQWFTSDEGIWIICQYTWLWGEEMNSFAGTVSADAFNSIAEEKEKKDGEFKIKIIRNHEKN